MAKQIIFALILIVLIGCTSMTQKPEHSMESMQHMSMRAGAENSLEVMNDVTITFERPSPETESEIPIAFILTKEGKPMADLQIMHDKLMHVVLVRNDLKHFDHIHPKQTAPGVFVIPYTFAAAGEYRIWADFTFDNMQHIVDFDINVTGAPEAEEPDKLRGIQVTISRPESIVAGAKTQIAFAITDADGKEVSITEKFLAADGHLIVMDETLDEFEHAHDEAGDKDNTLSFSYTPEKSGRHKAWVQFTVDSQNRTAGFEFDVT